MKTTRYRIQTRILKDIRDEDVCDYFIEKKTVYKYRWFTWRSNWNKISSKVMQVNCSWHTERSYGRLNYEIYDNTHFGRKEACKTQIDLLKNDIFMIGTTPVEMIQFHFHAYSNSRKVGYLYDNILFQDIFWCNNYIERKMLNENKNGTKI